MKERICSYSLVQIYRQDTAECLLQLWELSPGKDRRQKDRETEMLDLSSMYCDEEWERRMGDRQAGRNIEIHTQRLRHTHEHTHIEIE